MTSKEALETLFAGYYYNGNYQEVIEAREKIEKDLEVLDIIKSHPILFVEKGQLYLGRYVDVQFLLEEDDFDDEKDYKKLKEWLENDK